MDMIEAKRQEIVNNEFDVFQGPLYDQSGKLIAKKGETLGLDELLSMDWYVKGIEGKLPAS